MNKNKKCHIVNPTCGEPYARIDPDENDTGERKRIEAVFPWEKRIRLGHYK